MDKYRFACKGISEAYGLYSTWTFPATVLAMTAKASLERLRTPLHGCLQ